MNVFILLGMTDIQNFIHNALAVVFAKVPDLFLKKSFCSFNASI